MTTWVLALAYLLIVVQVSTFCTTIYLHRSLTHRGLTLHPVVSGPIQIWLWLFTGIVPREWAAVHRKHHRFSDEEGDPHSPKHLGVWNVLLTNAYLYKKETRNPGTVSQYTRDIPETPLERYVLRFGFTGIALGMAATMLAFGLAVSRPLWGAALGLGLYLLQAALYILSNAAINSICHVFGYKNFENGATNLRWVAWLTGGEGLHNNHHHAPTSAKFSARLSEIDPAWPVIKLLCLLRLAKERHPNVLTLDPVPEPKAS